MGDPRALTSYTEVQKVEVAQDGLFFPHSEKRVKENLGRSRAGVHVSRYRKLTGDRQPCMGNQGLNEVATAGGGGNLCFSPQGI